MVSKYKNKVQMSEKVDFYAKNYRASTTVPKVKRRINAGEEGVSGHLVQHKKGHEKGQDRKAIGLVWIIEAQCKLTRTKRQIRHRNCKGNQRSRVPILIEKRKQKKEGKRKRTGEGPLLYSSLACAKDANHTLVKRAL